MVVAVPIVCVMEVPGDEKIDVVAMRDLGVATTRAVNVAAHVTRAHGSACTRSGWSR